MQETGQTTVMVTHDPRSASIADRILFLADGNIVKELPRSEPHDVIAGDGGDQPDVIRFALKGLATRKLRTALTAIAIVLGVALVTGTYILTDSIKGAFNGIFTEVYRGTDATITGQAAFDLSNENNTTAAALRPVAARRGAASCRTSTRRSAASAARRT